MPTLDYGSPLKVGTDKDYLATSIAYRFNFTGPAEARHVRGLREPDVGRLAVVLSIFSEGRQCPVVLSHQAAEA